MELRKENNVIGHSIIMKKLSSGMKCYIIPKQGYGEKMAAVAIRYGANDLCYSEFLGSDVKKSPRGTAHFIEHKLFAQAWGDAFTAFTENGSSANAFTDFQKTAYYFTCRDNFDENMELLIRFIQNPYFTNENCEAEKTIITSEISMYDDDPSWLIYYNLLNLLYHNHPVKYPIAGSAQTVKDIDYQTLNRCYNAFYTPENMYFVCVGDVDADEVLSNAQKWSMEQDAHRAVTFYDKEPEAIVSKFKAINMNLAVPNFQIGFKQKPQRENKNIKKDVAMSIALDILAGESSEFSKKAIDSNILTDCMGFGYFSGEGFAFTSFNAESNAPEDVARLLLDEILRLKNNGISKAVFERIRKKQTGRLIRSFNSVNAICMGQLEAAFKGWDLFDRFQALNSIRLDEVQRMLDKEFNEEFMAISLAK